ncbi:MAG: NAD(P)/FAD-dependent oxidoreductase [Ilumatobacteraceae bacterium]
MEDGGTRAVVIGAGVVGSAIGLELARRGHEVTLVDRGPAPGHGSTAASSAVVRFGYSTEAGTAMAYEGVEWWRHWAEHVRLPEGTPLTRFVQCGVLTFDDPSGAARSTRPHLDAVGVRYDWWDHDQLARRYPHFATGSWFPPTAVSDPAFAAEPSSQLAGGVFTPEAGYVSDPQLAAQNLADAAVAAGATVLVRAEVVVVDRDGEHVRGVRLADGRFLPADVVVNAAGPHSAIVNRLAGVSDDVNVGLRPLRQQVAHVRVPEQFEAALADLPATADLDGGVYFRPDIGALLVGGVEADCDPLQWLDDPDDVNLDLDGDEWEAYAYRLARRIPDLGVPHERRGVVGVYDVSEDWKPILDRSSLEGFFMAVGTSGNQFKNGPVIGYCMAELIEAVRAGRDHDRDPLVVTGPYRGLSIDLGVFSRRRHVDTERSSGGVLG